MELNQRLAFLSFLEKNLTEVVAGRGVIGLEGQDHLELSDRFVHPPFLEQRPAEVVVGAGMIGFDFQGFLKLGDRLVHPAPAEKIVAEVIVGHPGVGIPGNRRPPEGFGISERPGLPPGQHAKCQQQHSAQRRFQKRSSVLETSQRRGDPGCRERHDTHATEILPVIRHE